MPPGTQYSTCSRCAAVSISPSVTSSTAWSVEGIMKEKGTDESLSSPKVRRLGSYPVREVKEFRVSSLSSAAEQRRFAMHFV